MNEVEQIVFRAIEGNPDAIEQLVDMYQESLLRYCYFLCHDVSIAQDLCQESFVHSIESISRLNSCSSFRAWLFKIAKNLYLDRIKKFDNNLKSLDQLTPDQIPMAINGDALEVHHVLSVLKSMSWKDRMVLLLVDLDQFSYKETGEILGLSENAVRSRLHRAKSEFIEKYGNDFDPSFVLLK